MFADRRDLQNNGVEQLVLVVEIKGDVEMKERVAKAKSKAGKEHFEQLSKRLLKENPINVEEKFRLSEFVVRRGLCLQIANKTKRIDDNV